jgi:hypothetical protein
LKIQEVVAMATDAQGRQLSDDGYYYWDGTAWQPVQAESEAKAEEQPDVPQELIAVGAPPTLASWPEEMKKAYFTGAGSQPRQEVTGDPQDQIEVLAINETGNGEQLA